MEDVTLFITIKDEENIFEKEVIAKKEIKEKYIKYEFKDSDENTTYKVFEDAFEIKKISNSNIVLQLLFSNKISSRGKIIIEKNEMPLNIKLINFNIAETINIEYLLEENYHYINIVEKRKY